MVINAWSRYLLELLSRFVRQLTISFHTFLGLTFHVVGPRRGYTDFPSMVVLSVPPAEIRDSNMVL